MFFNFVSVPPGQLFIALDHLLKAPIYCNEACTEGESHQTHARNPQAQLFPSKSSGRYKELMTGFCMLQVTGNEKTENNVARSVLPAKGKRKAFMSMITASLAAKCSNAEVRVHFVRALYFLQRKSCALYKYC